MASKALSRSSMAILQSLWTGLLLRSADSARVDGLVHHMPVAGGTGLDAGFGFIPRGFQVLDPVFAAGQVISSTRPTTSAAMLRNADKSPSLEPATAWLLTAPEAVPALGLSAGFEQPVATPSRAMAPTMARWRMAFERSGRSVPE